MGTIQEMQHTVLYKSWKQHPCKKTKKKQWLYSHLFPISQTILVRQTKHAGYCWRSKNELINNILFWTPSDRHASVGWPAKTYIHQLFIGTGYCLQDIPRVVDDRDKWWERVKRIQISSMMMIIIYLLFWVQH